MTKSPLCIYHGNCQDGFGAAWAVRHALGSSVEFYPGVYQNPPPDVTGRDVIIVDFSYKRSVLDEMAGTARSIIILDHHKSAMEDLANLPKPSGSYPSLGRCSAVFDMERSGAGLAWDFFHPEEPFRPDLIDHIEDRDLWRFEFPQTREISAALFSYPYDFKVWDKLMSTDVNVLASEGVAIERKHHKDIAELVKVTQRSMKIGGIVMSVANLPYTLTSDAGHKMADEADGVAACYWDTSEGRVFSLRSTDFGPDVSAIAKLYGGGGHAHAAGFRVPIGWEGETE